MDTVAAIRVSDEREECLVAVDLQEGAIAWEIADRCKVKGYEFDLPENCIHGVLLCSGDWDGRIPGHEGFYAQGEGEGGRILPGLRNLT
jgi:hypothetical protein